MKLNWIILTVVLALTACAEKMPVQENGMTGEEEQSSPVLPPDTETLPGSEAFLAHMHAHAEQLGRLNAALAAGDLESAHTPAYWLSQHQRLDEIPKDWQKYVSKMRDEARAVGDATDLATARAAAGRLVEGCQGCHTAQGVTVSLPTSTGR